MAVRAWNVVIEFDGHRSHETPRASLHQFYAPEDNTEDTQILFVVYGANVNFTPEGQFHSVLDAITIKAMTEQLSEAQGLGKINYITTGGAGYTAK